MGWKGTRLSTHHRGAQLGSSSALWWWNQIHVQPDRDDDKSVNTTDYLDSVRATEVQLKQGFDRRTLYLAKLRPNITASWLPT